MRMHSLRLALLLGTVLAATSLAAPAIADDMCLGDGMPCAILVDDSGTFIEITDVGTVPKLLCHGRQGEGELGGICDEAFSVCVKGRTDGPEIGVLGTTSFGLVPAPHGDPNNDVLESCEPFVQVLVKTNKGTQVRTVPLQKTADSFVDPETLDTIDAPVYDLSDQHLDLDGDPATPLQPLPQGSLVQAVVENRPQTACGRCIGVRTTIQHRVGTCKIWKIRKFFNVCKETKTITSIKEFERPCGCGEAAALPGPGGSRTATFSVFSTGEFITLASGGWTGAVKSRAGWVDSEDLGFEFVNCQPRQSLIDPSPNMECDDGNEGLNLLYLEVLLDFTPGGISLKKNQETFVTFHLDFE